MAIFGMTHFCLIETTNEEIIDFLNVIIDLQLYLH